MQNSDIMICVSVTDVYQLLGLINVGGSSQYQYVYNSISCWSDTMHKVSEYDWGF